MKQLTVLSLFLFALGAYWIASAFSGSPRASSRGLVMERSVASDTKVQAKGKRSEKSKQVSDTSTSGKKDEETKGEKDAPKNLSLFGQMESELRKINECYESEDCPFSKEDPRAYEYELGQDIKRRLGELTLLVKNNHLENDEISKLAREFLKNSDGHVKKAALDLMATQPPHPENLNSILNDSLKSYDSNLAGQSLMELQKYQGEGDIRKITNTMSEVMATGSFRVKLKVAELMMAYVNSKNVDHFERFAKTLPADSPVRHHLTAAVTEYRNRSTGG